MSIDIKLFTEIKIGQQWYLYGSQKILQDYILFEQMGHPIGGRQKILKGMPDTLEMCKLTACIYEWNLDKYYSNWLSANEILSLETWFESHLQKAGSNFCVERYWGFLCGSSWGGWVKNRSEYPSFIDDIRFVYWFDRE